MSGTTEAQSHPVGTLRVGVVVSALNEAKNLPHVLSRIPTWVHEVVLVDGDSTDGTPLVAQARVLKTIWQEWCRPIIRNRVTDADRAVTTGAITDTLLLREARPGGTATTAVSGEPLVSRAPLTFESEAR